MSRRGRRYDGEPKLNIKKVFAVLILLIVIIMCVVLIFRFATPSSETEEKVVTNSYLTVYSGGKWGVINSKGETIIEPTYDDMITIPDPTKVVFIYQSNVDLSNNTYDSKAIDDKSNELFTGYDKVEALQNIDSSNIVSYDTNALKVSKGGKYGLINFSGTELLACEYDSLTPLHGVRNSIVTVKDGKYGLVDNSGNVIIENSYTEITPLTNRYEDGYVVRDENENYGLINYNKRQVLECKYSEILNVYGNELYVVRENGSLKVINSNGETKAENGFDNVKSIDGNNIIIMNGNNYGVITVDGETKIEPTYEDLSYISGENYIARKDGKYGVINLSNETMVDFNYTNMIYMKDENFIEADREDGETDLLNTNFEVKVTGIVSEINSSDGYVKVRVDNDYKYYNFRLEEKTSQEIFTTNTLFLSRQNGKYGFVDKNGVVIVDYIYDDATEQNDYGYVAVKQNGKWGAIDQTGKVVVTPSYELAQNTVISFIGKWHLAPDLNANYYTDENE